jgi:signal peptidase II
MNANRIARLGTLFIVLVTGVGCDQASKCIASRVLAPPVGRQSYLGDTVRLEYAQNPGAFLGMGRNLADEHRFWILTIANGVLLAIVAGVLMTHWNMPRVYFAAWALILAGGIGNLIDRIAHDGLVTDFMNVGIGPAFRSGIFNVADMAITTGFCLFIACWRRDGKRPRAEST